MVKTSRLIWVILTLLAGVSSCAAPQTEQPTLVVSETSTLEATITPAPSATMPLSTSTPQPRLTLSDLGPDQENFPQGINPLTGRAVSDVELLNLPAVLVSISNMPVTARPQAGPGFAPWVFELYIGEGTTRFMNVFYGEYPRNVPNLLGGCGVRKEIVRPAGAWVGNRVWLDENANGTQDAWEFGVGGVCVSLFAESGELLQTVATDSNGYYSLGVEPNQRYALKFIIPRVYRFTEPNLGNDDTDSDANLDDGRTELFTAEDSASFFDAGLILTEAAVVSTPSIVPPNSFIPEEPYVGPIRSGRLTYNQIGRLFPNSCLVYASAAWDIGERLDACQIVLGVDETTPNSALLTVQQMRELAEDSLNPRQPVNYSGNLFSQTLPPNGQAAESVRIHYHAYTQSGWEYDPVSQMYLRFTDQADGNGVLSPATDRLTGRQMAVENVVVLFAEHERYRHNQLEINLRQGQKGWAYLFRDGQMFKIQWSTLNRTWEKTTGLVRPIYFVDSQNNLIPLHPGRTWIHLVTPFSLMNDLGDGRWLMQFVQPVDPLDTPTPEN